MEFIEDKQITNEIPKRYPIHNQIYKTQACEHQSHFEDVGRITNTLLRKLPWQHELIYNRLPPSNLKEAKNRFIVEPPY